MKHYMLVESDGKELLIGPYGKPEANRFMTDKALIASLGGVKIVRTIQAVQPMEFLKDRMQVKVAK